MIGLGQKVTFESLQLWLERLFSIEISFFKHREQKENFQTTAEIIY